MSLMQKAAQRAQQPPDDSESDGEGDTPDVSTDDKGGGQGEGSYTPPDVSKFTPPEVKDAVDRIVAAGMRIMYSPAAQEQIQQAIASPDPLPKKMAENVVGLLLTMDQQAKGGIPQAALFPAAMGLLGEACKVLEAAGQQCTQADYNDAALTMYALIGQKLGASPEQITGAAQQALPGDNGEQSGAQPPDQQQAPAAAPPGAA